MVGTITPSQISKADPRPMRYVFAFCLVVLPLAASAQTGPKSIQDCEGIKSDLAYNQCLANFGPAAHSRPGVVAPGQDPEVATPANPRRVSRHASRRGRHAFRGRKRASFSVGSSRRHGRRGRSGRRRR